MSENNGDAIIRVTIDLAVMQSTVPHQEQWLNDRLRNAGIPVLGVFRWDGVASGALEILTDFTDNKIRFKWTPDELVDKSPPE